MQNKLKTIGAFAALLVVSVSLLAAAGVTAADVEIANTSIDVDDNTSSVYAEIDNNASTDAETTITWEGVDSNGNVTGTLDSRTVTTTNKTTTLYEYQSVNASNYSDVRVTVTLNNSTASSSNVTATAGKFQQVEGSGGGTLDGSGTSKKTIGIVVAVVLVLAAIGRSD